MRPEDMLGKRWRLLMIAGIVSLCLTGFRAQEAEIPEPTIEPPIVDPGPAGGPPSDAVVLFDGTSLAAWRGKDGGDAKWAVQGGAMVVVPGTGDISTREVFGDCQLHIEWATPAKVEGDGQDRGNSGVFLQSRYEVQVLDSYENKTYYHGQAGAVYKQYTALVNASRPPGQWQTYDIVFRAPRFDDSGKLLAPARMTVFHNGVLIQDNVEIKGTTTHIGAPRYTAHPPAQPLLLQDHGNPIRFRNIWLRRLEPDSGATHRFVETRTPDLRR